MLGYWSDKRESKQILEGEFFDMDVFQEKDLMFMEHYGLNPDSIHDCDEVKVRQPNLLKYILQGLLRVTEENGS